MKKIVGLVCALTIMSSGALALVGCNETTANDETKKIMNLSLNPEVEFVLDANDRVISVNALNEEGNLILSAEAFTGKTAEEAATLFVKISDETGFLVNGNVKDGENEISISFSGDATAADALYEDVKGKVDEYLSKENITAKIERAAAITEAQLEALVAECAPYMQAAEVQALEYAELVETLYESRKETAEFYSQELKNAYYEAKAFAMEQAELETLKSKVSNLFQIAFDAAYKMYSETVSSIEDLRLRLLVNEDSLYQKGLASFREAKIAFLKYRNEVAEMEESEVTQEMLDALAQHEARLESAEASLLSLGEQANKDIDAVKATLQTQYEAVIEILESASVKISDHLTEVSENQKQKQTEFFTAFEEDYATAIEKAKTGWADMKAELTVQEDGKSA